MYIRSYAFAGAVIASFNAVGTEETPAAQVVVAGARHDQRREDTASTIVIGREELLRQGDRTLADALKRQPGITMRDGAGRTEIRMRGLGDGYTQILLNGIPVPAEFSLDSLAPELIERIDIVRTASAELGTQAIAGTINIILRKASPRARRTLKLADDEQRGIHAPSASGERAGSGDGYAYTVAATLGRTAVANAPQEREVRTDAAGAVDLLRHTRQHESDTTRTLTLSPRIDWKLGNGDTLTSQSFASLARRDGGVEAHESALTGAASSYPDRTSSLQLRSFFLRSDVSWGRNLGDGVRVDLKAGFNRSRRHSDFDFASMPGGVRGPGLHLVGADIRENGFHLGGKYAQPLAASHQLVLGWDASHATRGQTRVEHQREPSGALMLAGDDRYEGVIDRAAVFVQDDCEIDRAWSASAGLRWESLGTSVADTAGAAVRLRTPVFSPILQTLYKLAPDQQLRLGLSRSYKAPTMFALIPRRYTVDNNNSATNPDTQGNPALRPELAWGLDAVYDRYFGKDGMVSASMFLRRIDNVTVQQFFQDGAAWVSMPANQGRAVARGVALEAKLPLSVLAPHAPALALRANLARNWSRIERIPGPGNRLDAQTPFSANIGIDYQPRDTALSLGASFNLEGGGASRSSPQAGAYTSAARGLDIYGAWALGRATRLRINAVNLLRRDAVSALSYRAQGIRRSTTSAAPTFTTLRLTLEHEFGQ